MSKRSSNDFHAFATQGSSIAHADLYPGDLEEAVGKLKERFGLHLAASPSLYPEIPWGLSRASGRFAQDPLKSRWLPVD
jgi:hypothetical protein